MTQEPVVVRFEDVHKAFGSQKVLQGLSFELHEGRTLAIMGPSGTGKSVALKHVVGLLQPDRGRVLVRGQDVVTATRQELASIRRRMGYVFQEGALINWLSVGENVALPLRENSDLSDAEIREKAQEKLELVSIPDAWDKMVSEISGGMKKRVGIARALISDPELILYDEPNAGLDPEIAGSINELMVELQEELGVTSLVVEHRIECIQRVADEVLFLEEGRALVQLTPEDFFSCDIPRIVRFLGRTGKEI
jgi:phospholipid/cholesterol/gamma-HCH transport system ATP-binding protein